MVSWSLAAECLALVMIITILLFFYDKKLAFSYRRRIFLAALYLSLISIAINLAGAQIIENQLNVPHWFSFALNNCYFIITVFVATVLALYIFDLLLEYVDSKKPRIIACSLIIFLAVVYTMVIISNTWTNWVFTIDVNGIYIRGPLSRLGYAVIVLYLILVVTFYFIYRKNITKTMVKVVKILPPMVLLLIIFQYLFPDILLNGTITAYAELILFVNFQSLRVEEDGLTRIGSRNSCCEEIDLRVSVSQSFQVIIIHLSNFDAVNTMYGYKNGDKLLYNVASWLNSFSDRSSAFRFGKVSFALLCPYDGPQEAENNLSVVRKRFAQEWQFGGEQCHVPAHFVNFIYEKQPWSTSQLIEYLVYMLALAKDSKEDVVEFNDDIIKTFEYNKYITSKLENIENNDCFEVWYQPIYDCSTGKFSNAEALIRMRDSDGNVISPGEIIPIAEKEGLTDNLTKVVFKQVCEFLGNHKELDLKSVSINVSVPQLELGETYPNFCNFFTSYGISPENVKFEVTERAFMYNRKNLQVAMEQIIDKGIGFYLDDFGAGYSNFARVMHLPLECVKMDKSLFDEILENNKDKHILRVLVDLFHSIDMQVLAEGIETEEQLEMVKYLGVDKIQGFIYAKPMSSADLVEFYNNLN
ncbi:MAG: GGDEF domain-containing protein [Bacillota bacterium]|nr:GGDEF domain-containing protein [Bacillota bacterium]